jgi:hypothetical protein
VKLYQSCELDRSTVAGRQPLTLLFAVKPNDPWMFVAVAIAPTDWHAQEEILERLTEQLSLDDLLL